MIIRLSSQLILICAYNFNAEFDVEQFYLPPTENTSLISQLDRIYESVVTHVFVKRILFCIQKSSIYFNLRLHFPYFMEKCAGYPDLSC